jgi:hypothetical protein
MKPILPILLLFVLSIHAQGTGNINCWSEGRITHAQNMDNQAIVSLHNKRLNVIKVKKSLPVKNRIVSPDSIRAFVFENTRDSVSCEKSMSLLVFNEKNYLTQLRIDTLYFAKAKWIALNLVLIEIWYSRICGVNMIWDAENEKVVAVLPFEDDSIAFQQLQESCNDPKNKNSEKCRRDSRVQLKTSGSSGH